MKIGPFAQKAHIFWGGRRQKEHVCVADCACTPAAHYAYIQQNLFLYLQCVKSFFFFHLLSDEDGGPSQRVIVVWAGICSLSGPQSWKLGGSGRYGQLGAVETWTEICFWSDARAVAPSQNTARKSHLNRHVDAHTFTRTGTWVKTTAQMRLMYALNKRLKICTHTHTHTPITRGCLDHPRCPVTLISPLPA